MSKHTPRILLEDIIECIENIEEFRSSTYQDFASDKKTQHAIIRNLEVIGESANRISKEYRIQHPDIEWNKIIRTRHILIHEYDAINLEIIWKVITIHLPILKENLKHVLSSFSNE